MLHDADRSDEAQGDNVGKDTNDIGASLDLGVQSLERVRRSCLNSVKKARGSYEALNQPV